MGTHSTSVYFEMLWNRISFLALRLEKKKIFCKYDIPIEFGDLTSGSNLIFWFKLDTAGLLVLSNSYRKPSHLTLCQSSSSFFRLLITLQLSLPNNLLSVEIIMILASALMWTYSESDYYLEPHLFARGKETMKTTSTDLLEKKRAVICHILLDALMLYPVKGFYSIEVPFCSFHVWILSGVNSVSLWVMLKDAGAGGWITTFARCITSDMVINIGETMAVALQPIQKVSTMKKPVMKQRRVVVTGMGVVTPLGYDPDIFYNNLLDGVSGISEIETFDCAQFPTVGLAFPFYFTCILFV